MGSDIPKKSFVIGYEMENGSLTLYAGRTDPERFSSYDEAKRMSERFNAELNSRLKGSKSGWKVYRMKFEETE